MAKTATIHMRVDPHLKANVEQLFNDLGLSTTEAINIFLNQAIIHGGLPFDVKINPNKITLEAMKEAENISKSGKSRFENIEEMFSELEK